MYYPKWSQCAFFVALTCSLRAHAAKLSSLHDMAGINRYLSRPDILAPKWEVTVYDKAAVSPGFWFVAPFENIGQTEAGDSWIGPHIYDGDGELVWSGSKLFGDWNTYDFRISNVFGQERMTLVAGRDGHAVVLGNDYRVEESFRMGTLGIDVNVHELNFIHNGTRVLIANEAHKKASAAYSKGVDYAPGDCNTVFQGFKEIDVKAWKSVFSWSTSDHVPLNESTYLEGSLSQRCNGSFGWDYFHMNSIDKSDDGDYFVSGRHVDTIYKVSGKDGSVLWRLGGLHSDFQQNGFHFMRQHDIRYRGKNATHTFLSFLDNAKGLDKNKPSYMWSRGIIIAIQDKVKPWTATVTTAIDHPDGLGHYAFRRGNLQQLPNDHIWMDWSEQALQSEHTPDGKIVMKAQMTSEWLGTYRSYKFPFVGKPSEPIAVHSQAYGATDNTTRTLVHVSWNGATEVASWALYKTTHSGEPRVFVGSIPRQGFETPLAYDGYASYVVLEALDEAGNVLSTSDIFKTIPPEDMNAAVADEVLWLQRIAAAQAEGLSPHVQEAMDEAAADHDAASLVAVSGLHIGLFFVGFLVSIVIMCLMWRFRNTAPRVFTAAVKPFRDARQHYYRHHHHSNAANAPLAYSSPRDSDDLESAHTDVSTTEVHVYSDK